MTHEVVGQLVILTHDDPVKVEGIAAYRRPAVMVGEPPLLILFLRESMAPVILGVDNETERVQIACEIIIPQ